MFYDLKHDHYPENRNIFKKAFIQFPEISSYV